MTNARKHQIQQTAQPDADTRDRAWRLLEGIRSHQYGLRGFGDGSLTRGRNLTDTERRVITEALTAFIAETPLYAAVQPIPRQPTGLMLRAGYVEKERSTRDPNWIHRDIWIAMHDAFTKEPK